MRAIITNLWLCKKARKNERSTNKNYEKQLIRENEGALAG